MSSAPAIALFAQRRRPWDWALALLLLAFAWLQAFQALDNNGKPRNFFSYYHPQFSAAVMVGCGRGLHAVDRHVSPELERFLAFSASHRAQSFDCANLPADAVAEPLTGFQSGYRNLMLMLGYIWQWSGVSWPALFPFLALFHGVAVVLAYGLFRLVSAPLIAAPAALFIAIAPPILWTIKTFRDYSKIPFFFALFLILGLLARRALSPWRLRGLALLAGAIAGVAVGFRPDVYIFLPGFILTLALFLPPIPTPRPWLLKAQLIGLLLLGFVLLGLPTLKAHTGESGSGIMPVMGLGKGFSHRLNVTHSVAEVSYIHADRYAHAFVFDYLERIDGLHLTYAPENSVDLLTADYSRAGQAYWNALLELMPGDHITRAIAAAWRVLEMGPLGRYGPLLFALLLLLIARRSPRLAIFLALATLFFAGYSSLVFLDRHIGHLLIIPMLFTLWALQGGLSWALQRRPALAQQGWIAPLCIPPALAPAPPWRAQMRNMALTLMALGALTAAPLWAARAWQQHALSGYIQEILDAPTEPIAALETHSLTDGWVRLTHESLSRPRRTLDATAQAHYLRLRWNGPACGLTETPLRMLYRASREDFSRATVLHLGDQPLTLFWPIYQADWSRFVGIELPAKARNCLVSAQRLRDPLPFPALLLLSLPDDWRARPLYQTLAPPQSPELFEPSPFFTHDRVRGFNVPAGEG
ncbi:hypothetical protein [Magnetofaba australis]|uniref:Putative transmembrane protein n=1 Tax=Magnetofaba australis IT-1 TaxID=1434232 RepID=A0A1Y2K2I8_9PROT|nr:hypothetical protein [Magnetofaba australis]OSM02248.1 putative transmembrane protein [Magnetofaba australis IT-1]